MWQYKHLLIFQQGAGYLRPQYRNTYNPTYSMVFRFLIKGMFVEIITYILSYNSDYIILLVKFEYETKFGCESMRLALHVDR